MRKWKFLAVLGFGVLALARLSAGKKLRSAEECSQGFMSCVFTPHNRAGGTRSRRASQIAQPRSMHGMGLRMWVIGFRNQSDPELGISAAERSFTCGVIASKAGTGHKRLKAAHDDPEFNEVVTQQEQNPDTRLIVKAHNIDMIPNGSFTAIAITK